MPDRKLVLVTGANGFVGSHLTEALLERGYRVRCAVRNTSDLSLIGHLPVETVPIDLQDPDSLARACAGVHRVCHCAAQTRARDEETFFRVNTRGTTRLARAAQASSPALERFLYVSSLAAAGPASGPDEPLDESSTPRPITWYGKSKLAAEQALLGLAGALPVTIVRPSPVFGPRDRDFLAYFRLVRMGLALHLGRNGRRICLAYVHDVVDLIIRALEAPQASGQTYFATGEAASYRELSELIAEALNRRTLNITLPESVLVPITLWADVQIRLTGRPALLNGQRALDMRERFWLCSGAKAQRELGFTPTHDLPGAVKLTADWYREAGWI